MTEAVALLGPLRNIVVTPTSAGLVVTFDPVGEDVQIAFYTATGAFVQSQVFPGPLSNLLVVPVPGARRARLRRYSRTSSAGEWSTNIDLQAPSKPAVYTQVWIGDRLFGILRGVRPGYIHTFARASNPTFAEIEIELIRLNVAERRLRVEVDKSTLARSISPGKQVFGNDVVPDYAEIEIFEDVIGNRLIGTARWSVLTCDPADAETVFDLAVFEPAE